MLVVDVLGAVDAGADLDLVAYEVFELLLVHQREVAHHRELELLVAGGIPPMDAIRIGTLNSARFLGRDRDMGSVEEGKIADLVLLNANPLEDINNAKQISMVMKAGKIIDRSKLDLPVNRKASSSARVPMLMSSIESAEQ